LISTLLLFIFFLDFVIKSYVNVRDSLHCLCCVGTGVDHDALVELAEKHFNGLRSTYESQDVLQPCRYTGSEVSEFYCTWGMSKKKYVNIVYNSLVLLKNYWLHTVIMTIKIHCSFRNVNIHFLCYPLSPAKVQIMNSWNKYKYLHALGVLYKQQAHVFCVPVVWQNAKLILVLQLDWKFVNLDILWN